MSRNLEYSVSQKKCNGLSMPVICFVDVMLTLIQIICRMYIEDSMFHCIISNNSESQLARSRVHCAGTLGAHGSLDAKLIDKRTGCVAACSELTICFTPVYNLRAWLEVTDPNISR